MKNISDIVKDQREYFFKGETKNIEYRKNALKKLKGIIKENEQGIFEAIRADLGKSDFETYMTEVGIVYEEINLALKNINSWSKRERVKDSISNFPSKSYIYKEPYGVVLIIGPFNYPFQLIIAPLIGAITAGNCAIIKPSENSVNTALLLEKIINNNFKEEYIRVVNPLGGKETVTELLESDFDYIFFTGSVRVGKIVMEKAAKKLIPVTLELGGKSPVIVEKDCNIHLAAKRLVWGKLLNAGQTCVAPDYLYVHKDIKDRFLKLLVEEITKQYGDNQKESLDFGRIISEREMERLLSYLNEGNVYYGGEYSIKERYISPTILVNINKEARIRDEEIFGPILPVYDYENIEDVLDYINRKDKPLALYYFSENKAKVEYVLRNTTSGGVSINDTILHVASPYLPFGGVGTSGLGSYHGKESFLNFSHKKSVLKRGTKFEVNLRFAPFKNKINLLKKVMK